MILLTIHNYNYILFYQTAVPALFSTLKQKQDKMISGDYNKLGTLLVIYHLISRMHLQNTNAVLEISGCPVVRDDLKCVRATSF